MLLSLQPRRSLQNTRSSSYQTKSAAQGCIKLPQLPLSNITHPPSARQSITSHLQALHAQTFLAARIQKSGQTHRLLLNHKHTKDVLIKREKEALRGTPLVPGMRRVFPRSMVRQPTH